MIAPGGPKICGACLTLMHEPKPDCPAPHVADPDDLPPLDRFARFAARASDRR